MTWPVWIALGGILGCWALSYCLASNLREQILYSGTCLQAFGLLTVAVGIRQLRRMFGKPSMYKNVYNWFQLVVSAFRKTASVHITGTGCFVAAGDALVASGSISSEMTLEMRVDILEKALNDLREQHAKCIKDLDDNLSRVESLIRDESNKRQLGDTDISKMLEEVAVGGIHLEIVGLVWLLLGMFGTSIPDKLTKLF
jgi:hypothetical protein